MPEDYPGRLRGWRFILLNVVIGLANVVVLSNVPGYTISTPYVAGSLEGVSQSFAGWATSDYMIGLALGFPIARWFAARYGDYLVYGATLAIYAFFSLLCVSAETIFEFAPIRFLLGLNGGVLLPVGQAILLGEYAAEKRALGVAIWSVLSMMPFTVGTFMGGFWSEYFDWRTMFVSNAVIALSVSAITSSMFYGRKIKRRIARFDGVGFLLLVITVLCVQTIFNQGNDFDWFGWSWFMFGALIIALVTFPCFIIWELGERRPAIDLRLLAYRNYAIAVICSVIGFLIIQGQLSVFVIQMQLLLGYSSSLAGILYLSMVVVSVPFVVIIFQLCRKFDVRLISSLNFLGFAAVMLWMGKFDQSGDFDAIGLPVLFFGLSLAAFFTPLSVLAVQGIPLAKMTRVAEELTFLRTTAGAFGIALQAVVIFRRAPFHQLDLADHLGGRRFASLDLLSQFTNQLETSGVSANMVEHEMGLLIHQQATLLGLNDAFLLGTYVFIALAVFVWLAESTVPSAKPVEKLREAEAQQLME